MELIVRSVMREYGIRLDIRRIALFEREWKIEIAVDGTTTTLTALDSSAQNMRGSIIAALGLEVQ